MKHFALVCVLLFSCLGLSFQTVCPQYMCSQNSLNPNPNAAGTDMICAKYTNSGQQSTISVGACSNSSYGCDSATTLTAASTTAYCSAKPVSKGPFIPGNTCTSPSQCLSGVCTNKVCVGKGLSQTCSPNANAECDTGYYCNGAPLWSGQTYWTCQNVRQIGESCGTAWKCGYGLVCNSGICTRMLSLAPGKMVSGDSTVYQACSSLYSTFLPNGTTVCSDPISLVGDQLRTTTDDSCVYTRPDKTQIDSIKPKCAYSKSGNAVCPLGMGNLTDQVNYVIKMFYSKDLANLCHIDQPPYTVCGNLVNKLHTTNQLVAYLEALSENFGGAKAYVNYTTRLTDNSKCTKDEITYDYWGLLGNTYTLSSRESVQIPFLGADLPSAEAILEESANIIEAVPDYGESIMSQMTSFFF